MQRKPGSIFKSSLFPAALLSCLTAGAMPLPVSASDTAGTTVLIYMIGSDLETIDGSATEDLNEMLEAYYGSDVNVIIQTGGTKKWHNKKVSSGTCQRFSLENREMNLITDIGLCSMVSADTLTDFLVWGTENYPAEQYDLIFWDHGGGVLGGFGSDEYYPDDYLSLSAIEGALSSADIHFSFIGFDACLMGTIEVASALAPYSDYLIASEETEPGYGWYYTNWLSELGNDPYMSAEDLGSIILEDFEYFYETEISDNYSLSLIDLGKIDALYQELCLYMDDCKTLLDNQSFAELSSARASAKAFGEGEFDQIDLQSYVDLLDSVDGSNLLDALDDCVVNTVSNIQDANGLSIYFPYQQLDYYEYAAYDLNNIEYLSGYEDFYNSFASVLAGGQQYASYTDTSSWTTSSTDYDFSSFDWFDSSVSDSYQEYYENNSYTLEDMVDKGDYYAYPFTDDDWDIITYIAQWIYLDDGEGYIDLGEDNFYEVDDDGDLMLDFDYYWVALDGQIVPFYAEAEDYSTDNWNTYGYVPAELNGEDDIEIVIRWDAANPDGYVAGWRYQSGSSVTASAKGLYSFHEGDEIQIYCDYYTYDGEYDGQYYWGDAYVYTGDDFEVSYEYLGEETVVVIYYLEDIYQNTYTTDPITLYWE